MSTQQHLTVIGLGYVGLPLALLAREKGFAVAGIDIDATRVGALSRGESPLPEPAVAHALKDQQHLTFSTDPALMRESQVIVICVPTPVDQGHLPDLGPVIAATESVGKHLQSGQLVILESTVNPEVTESVVLPVLEAASGLTGGKDFYLAHAPERINPGDPKWDVENINRVVGGLNAESLEKAVAFYEAILTGSVHPMGSLKEAEAVKVVENSFRDINIAFVNELARSFSRLGIDTVNVINGAATKPFAFMPHYPGCGVGGHCIPVDPYYLIEHAKQNGFEHDFLSLARRINNGMPAFTVEQLIAGLNVIERSVRGSTVAVLGVSYKANIGDCRESPAFAIICRLQELGADVRVFDPHVPEESTVPDLATALERADAVVVATAHEAFTQLDPAQLQAAGVRVCVDGRNVLDKTLFADNDIIYKGIGR